MSDTQIKRLTLTFIDILEIICHNKDRHMSIFSVSITNIHNKF